MILTHTNTIFCQMKTRLANTMTASVWLFDTAHIWALLMFLSSFSALTIFFKRRLTVLVKTPAKASPSCVSSQPTYSKMTNKVVKWLIKHNKIRDIKLHDSIYLYERNHYGDAVHSGIRTRNLGLIRPALWSVKLREQIMTYGQLVLNILN